ncbi:DUF4157 domain-containing protein [Bradyrhizobium niftali]|uniref:DUF4157 domain-containing protein n=2 Tax=Bradyrhizobium niftali TaxID=2560055 RepID=A0A4Y9M5B8_9BRAD|nr:DUF4157 domain-containing protein [Bradyrhizobium niftali]
MQAGVLRPKLKIGGANDPEEREADCMADNAVNGGACCESCAKAQPGETLRMKPIGSGPTDASGGGSGDDSIMNGLGSGEPLNPRLQNLFQPRFGPDLSGVRLHTGSDAQSAAESIGARAFAVGNNIAFGAGQFQPETNDGQRLLAHELAHVALGHPGIRRDPLPDAKNSPSSSFTDAGPVRASSDFYSFRGVLMTTDAAFMLGELRRLIRRTGILGGDLWYEALQGHGRDVDLPFSAHARGYGGLRTRTPLDVKREMEEESYRNRLAPIAVPLAIWGYPIVRAEAVAFITKFRSEMKRTLETVLQESERRIGVERTLYGIKKEGGGFFSGPPTYEAQNTVAFQALVGAATDLLEIRKRSEVLRKQQWGLMRLRGGHAGPYLPEENRPQYEDLGRQINDVEAEYTKARIGAALRHPALGAILDDADTPWIATARLEKLAKGDLKTIPGTHPFGPSGAAYMIGQVLDNRQDSIDTVRKKIDDDPDKLWNIASIVSLTRVTMGTANLTMADRVVDDKLAELAFDEQLKGLFLGIVALVLAIPTGGTSLAVGAAVAGATISAITALKSIQQYQLEMALTNTDLDKRASAIATEEPSLFWVALDVVFAVADGAAALKAFRSLKSEAKAAMAAKGAEAAEAEERLVKAADNIDGGAKPAAEGGAKPSLGQRLRATLARMRKTAPEGQALSAGGKAEAAAIARATESIGKEAAETVTAIAGHEVKVTKSGHLVICTECSWLRERFGPELAKDKNLLARVEKAEETAKAGSVTQKTRAEIEGLAKDLQSAQKARVTEELGADAAKALEHINTEMDKLRGTFTPELKANPGLEAEAARIEAIVDPIDKATELAALKKKLEAAAQLGGEIKLAPSAVSAGQRVAETQQALSTATAQLSGAEAKLRAAEADHTTARAFAAKNRGNQAAKAQVEKAKKAVSEARAELKTAQKSEQVARVEAEKVAASRTAMSKLEDEIAAIDDQIHQELFPEGGFSKEQIRAGRRPGLVPPTATGGKYHDLVAQRAKKLQELQGQTEGLTKSLAERVNAATPGAEAKPVAMKNATEIKTPGLAPTKGAPIDVTTGAPIKGDEWAVDHIVSRNEIAADPRFRRLSPKEMDEILLDLPENYLPITKEANSSKGALSVDDWIAARASNKKPLPDAVVPALRDADKRARAAIEKYFREHAPK